MLRLCLINELMQNKRMEKVSLNPNYFIFFISLLECIVYSV